MTNLVQNTELSKLAAKFFLFISGNKRPIQAQKKTAQPADFKNPVFATRTGKPLDRSNICREKSRPETVSPTALICAP